MIEVMFYYAIFALTTGIFSVYNLFIPTLRILQLRGDEEHVLITNKYLSGAVFLVLSTIAAPWFIPSVLSDKRKILFIQGFLEDKND